jgi:hypothetical protein
MMRLVNLFLFLADFARIEAFPDYAVFGCLARAISRFELFGTALVQGSSE